MHRVLSGLTQLLVAQRSLRRRVWAAYCGLLAVTVVYFFQRTGRFRSEVRPQPSPALLALEERGSAVAALRYAVFGGVARDSAWSLRRVLHHIDASGRRFKDYRVVVFENDSGDNTKAVLAELAATNPRMHFVSRDEGVGRAMEFGGLHATRFQRMARFRRQLLAAMREARAQFPPGVPDDAVSFIMVDMDLVHGWEPRLLTSAFGFPPTSWDVVCANGVVNDGHQWDTLALRTAEFNDTRIFAQRHAAHAPLPLKPSLLPVTSCFGGVALYALTALEGCAYPEGPDCEHVLQHACMREHGRGRVFINPVFIVAYGVQLDLILPVPALVALFASLGLAAIALAWLECRAAGHRQRQRQRLRSHAV